MGNCMSNDEIKGSHSYFLSDIVLEQKSQIYKPLTTTLYNTLRKTSDCVIIAGNNCTLNNDSIDIMKIDFENVTANTLKTLLNFKKIIYIGSLQKPGQAILKKIKQTVSFTKFYVVSEEMFKAFLKEHPIFLKQNWLKYQIVTNKLPLMIIDSNQFVNKTQPRIKLFIHTTAKKNTQIYKLLGVTSQNMIINEPPSQGNIDHKKSYYVNALKNMKQNMIVFLHNPSMNSTQICDTLSTFLSQKYKLPYRFGQFYLLKNWPNSQNKNSQNIKPQKQQHVAKTSSIIITSSQKYAKYLQKLQEESNEQKTERAYNLLSTLIINIYSNPNNQQSYRQVKRTNRQINDLLIKYKHGLKLLDQLGFRQKDQYWVNTVQSKYLKIYKTDFDLGFKKYKTRDAQK